MRLSVATRYQLGLDFHAGAVTAPLRASTPDGICESIASLSGRRACGLIELLLGA